jgi:hypothetical protein
MLPNDRLWGAFRVLKTEGSRLVLVGWALGISEEVESVQVLAEGAVVGSTTLGLPRLDVAEQFPDRPTAASCGFELALEAKGKGKSVLYVRAVLEDGTEKSMGEIRAVAPARRWSDVLRRH